jgi:hypothetical protein
MLKCFAGLIAAISNPANRRTRCKTCPGRQDIKDKAKISSKPAGGSAVARRVVFVLLGFFLLRMDLDLFVFNIQAQMVVSTHVLVGNPDKRAFFDCSWQYSRGSRKTSSWVMVQEIQATGRQNEQPGKLKADRHGQSWMQDEAKGRSDQGF